VLICASGRAAKRNARSSRRAAHRGELDLPARASALNCAPGSCRRSGSSAASCATGSRRCRRSGFGRARCGDPRWGSRQVGLLFLWFH